MHLLYFLSLFVQQPPLQAKKAATATNNAKPNVCRVRAKYDFKPQEEGELPMSFGDIIVVLDKSDENWWRGECNGKRGMFPAPYVEEIK